MKHWRYLKYVVRHKWFVLLAGLKIKAPLWRLLVHDLSKFLPGEWLPYVDYFYGGPHTPWAEVSGYGKTHHFELERRMCNEEVEKRFDLAWLRHQHRNPHHWQYWRLREDSGEVKLIPMADAYVLEMVADWAGAGKAITGKWEVVEWYTKNRDKMEMHPQTEGRVGQMLTFFTEDANA